jgi:hypothetical protein
VSEIMMSGTGEGLIAFLEWTAERGVLNRKTADAQRTAATRILDIEANPLGVDISTLDVEDLLDRFARLRSGNYSPDSLATYQSRFRRAVDMYLEYLQDPADFRPPKRKVVVRRKPGAKSSTATPAPARSSSVTFPELHAALSAGGDEVIQYPFPLQSGHTAYLHLPRQLGKSDVDRLIRFLQSLVIDSAPIGELQAGD